MFNRFIKSSQKDLFSEKLKQAGFDEDKYRVTDEIISGIENYILFQKYSDFSWPLWVTSATKPSLHNNKSKFPQLINTLSREEILFSNYFSHLKIVLDSTGLIFPADQLWSIEPRVKINGELIRPCDDLKKFRVFRSAENGITGFEWKSSLFRFQLSLFGIDNPWADINFTSASPQNSSFFICIMPYNNKRLGGVHEIEYSKQTGIIKINGQDSLFLHSKPSSLYSGSALHGNKSSEKERTESNHIIDGEGTAFIDLEFKSKENSFSTAISISISKTINPILELPRIKSLKDDFIGFTGSLLNKGAQISTPDPLFNDWFNSLKINLTGTIFKTGHINDYSAYRDLRTIFYSLAACNRLGLLEESKKVIETIGERVTAGRQVNSFHSAMGASYYILAIADLFTHLRDPDYLRETFPALAEPAEIIYKFFNGINSFHALKFNTIPLNSIARGEPADLIPAAAALSLYSYLARNIGIFGEEIRFAKLSEAIQNIITDYMSGDIFSVFDYNMLYGGFPFTLKSFSIEKRKNILKKTLNKFGDRSLFVPSAGIDSAGLIVLSVNQLVLGQQSGVDSLYELMNRWKDGFTVPEFIDPDTGRGMIYGESDTIISPLMVLALRTMLFNDADDILELFPAANDNWFSPGKKTEIKNAPSRYGYISITVTASQGDICLTFDQLPKFIPPSISINLPYKTTIIESDEFILKKTEGNKHFINGWPSLIRMIRK